MIKPGDMVDVRGAVVDRRPTETLLLYLKKVRELNVPSTWEMLREMWSKTSPAPDGRPQRTIFIENTLVQVQQTEAELTRRGVPFDPIDTAFLST